MKRHDLEINNFKISIPKWGIGMVLDNQNIVSSLVAEPAGALMSADGEEANLALAAAIELGIRSIGSSNLRVIIPKLLFGVEILNDNKIYEGLTLENSDRLGVEIDTLLLVCVAIIKYNYGGLLKNDLGAIQEILKGL